MHRERAAASVAQLLRAARKCGVGGMQRVVRAGRKYIHTRSPFIGPRKRATSSDREPFGVEDVGNACIFFFFFFFPFHRILHRFHAHHHDRLRRMPAVRRAKRVHEATIGRDRGILWRARARAQRRITVPIPDVSRAESLDLQLRAFERGPKNRCSGKGESPATHFFAHRCIYIYI